MQPANSLNARLSGWFMRVWYGPRSSAAICLLPFSGLFALLSGLRRILFRRHILASGHLPVPVVVVGNITVGGTGKTPLTIYLAHALVHLGWKPGIVSRGYGRTQGTACCAVTAQSTPADVGDEPLLLFRASGVPVFVGANRHAAAQALLAAHPDTTIILCDDGLQHYRLARDVEICVIDATRNLGNRLLLPAGPLREPVQRLKQVDAVVMNGRITTPFMHSHLFQMALQPQRFYCLGNPQQTCTAADLTTQPLIAMCGIGNPQRFFASLSQLGLHFTPLAFTDHHHFTAADLPQAETILVTEKDAMKLAALPDLGLVSAKIWVLPVMAEIEPDLGLWLHERLRDGRQTA